MIDLRFDHVSKKYRVQQDSDADAATHPWVRKLKNLRRRSQEFWAVRDVSFEVERGEAVGIIGHNGAGKSTILKLLSSIITPTSGEIMINGRLSALIEVGSGFHPELTGRENVYLSGSILGMRRREIKRKLDDIVDFAGVRQFIDTPVKRYSSGMYVRLGFAIAAHLDPEILLLDEVLAVGDANFQAKCLQRIEELEEAGTTIVFISHDLSAVERICDRVLLMDHGQIVAAGRAKEVIQEYANLANRVKKKVGIESPGDEPKLAEVLSVKFYNDTDEDVSTVRTGETLKIRVTYSSLKHIERVVCEVFFYSGSGKVQTQFSTELSGKQRGLEKGIGAFEFTCDEFGLQPGFYHIDATLVFQNPEIADDWKHSCATLRVDAGKIVRGNFYMPHEWAHASTDTADGLVFEEEMLREITARSA